MMRMPLLRLSAATLVGVFALSACSSDGGATEYEFTAMPDGPTSSLVIRLPQEIVGKSEEYQKERVFESYTVTGVDAEDSSRCAAEIEFEYADGGLERYTRSIEKELAATPTSDKTVGERMASDLSSANTDDAEMAEDYGSAVVPLQCAVSPHAADKTLTLDFRTIDDKSSRDSLATVEIGLMAGGEVFIHDSELDDWQTDANGNWISTN